MLSLSRIRKGILNRSRRLIYGCLLRSLVKGTLHHLEKLGSHTGGWVVPTDLITADWICYCGGVGEDISFDLELIEKFDCNVYAFDPTPRAVAHVQKYASDNLRFNFFDYGLWSENTQMKFYASRNSQLVNHSIVNLQGTNHFFMASCKRLSRIMQELGHHRIDLLKIDIEGAEYEVLRTVIEDELSCIQVLCVEFDQPMPVQKTYRMTKEVVSWGYVLVNIDNWNFTFLRNDLV